jgi:hypothetical protein
MLYLVRSRGLCTLQEQCSGQEKSWLSWISVSFITNTLPQASVNYFLTRFDFNLETSSSQVKTKSDSAYLVSTWFSLKYVSTHLTWSSFLSSWIFLLLHLHPLLLWLLFQFHITSSILFIGTSDIFWVGAWMVSVSLFDGSLGFRSSIPIW